MRMSRASSAERSALGREHILPDKSAVVEGRVCAIAKRDGDAPPGLLAAANTRRSPPSRMTLKSSPEAMRKQRQPGILRA
jgi:hypothetical protein